MKPLLILLSILLVPFANAQKYRATKLSIKNKYLFEETGPGYVMVALGVLASYPFKNKNDVRDKYFQIATRPRLYLSAVYHKPISPRFEWFSGIQLTQNKQGLVFKFSPGRGNIKEYAYSVSDMLRIPFGITYRLTPSLNVGVAATFVYAAHLSTRYTGSIKGDFTNTKLVAYSYKWVNDFEDDKYYAAADIYVSKNITKRISVQAQMSIDAKRSVLLSGEATLEFEGGIVEKYEGVTRPQLMYGGIGVSYRF